MSVDSPRRRRGKSEIALLSAKLAAESGKRVAYMTLDLRRGIEDLRNVMPGCLVEVGAHGALIPHPKKKETDR